VDEVVCVVKVAVVVDGVVVVVEVAVLVLVVDADVVVVDVVVVVVDEISSPLSGVGGMGGAGSNDTVEETYTDMWSSNNPMVYTPSSTVSTVPPCT